MVVTPVPGQLLTWLAKEQPISNRPRHSHLRRSHRDELSTQEELAVFAGKYINRRPRGRFPLYRRHERAQKHRPRCHHPHDGPLVFQTSGACSNGDDRGGIVQQSATGAYALSSGGRPHWASLHFKRRTPRNRRCAGRRRSHHGDRAAGRMGRFSRVP